MSRYRNKNAKVQGKKATKELSTEMSMTGKEKDVKH